MSKRSNEELVPRDGHTLRVLIICRISGCQKQKELSLEDQEDNAKERAAELYSGPIEYRVISTTAKGESLDRPELEQIEEAIRSGEYDLIIIDDLSRLIRGGEAARLLGIGVDHGTRTICIQDAIDTVESTWEEDALNACSENVAHNERTSRRIKQKTMNRFKKTGETPRRPIAGICAPVGATSCAEWTKIEKWDKCIDEGRQRLLRELNFNDVADDFNSAGFPVGPRCRQKQWDGVLVKAFFSNPLLMGVARRGVMHTIKYNEAGRRKSVRNPQGPTFYDCPQLKRMSREEFEELQTLFKQNAEAYKRTSDERDRSRLNVPRKSTRFPGQFARCWYCGRRSYWGGNGLTHNLMCNGARSWRCWNSFGYNGAIATQNVVDCILQELEVLQGFDDQYRAMIDAALEGNTPDIERRWQQLRKDERQLVTETANVQDAMRAFGGKPMVLAMIEKVEEQERTLAAERRALERLGQRRLALPESLDVLRGMLRDEFAGAAHDSPEFGNLLQKVVASFHVYLVRLCDGGGLLPRAKVTLALDGIVPDLKHVFGGDGLLRRDVTIDLFVPPERARIRERAAEFAAQDFGPKAIAALIAREGVERPTSTAVQRALKLQRLMLSQGLTSPYVLITEPPEGYTRMRRHKHARYRFEPVEGYVPPPL